MSFPRGYSTRTVAINRDADSNNPGVRLGRFCIAKDIPVSDVSKFFNVSRQTVYFWFSGHHTPSRHMGGLIEEFLNRVKA